MKSAVLDDFLKEVQLYLPPWNAKEILDEIRSHVLDKAEGLAEERGTQVDEAILVEVIKQMGDPKKLAKGYVEPVTLIRPEYTTAFLIYSGLIVALPLFVLFIVEVFDRGRFGAALGNWMGNSLLVVGLLFLFFCVLSRMERVYQLPLWLPGFGHWKESWRPDSEKVEQTIASVHKNMQAAVQTMEKSVKNATQTMERTAHRLRYRAHQHWMHSTGPRPLGIFAMTGSAIKLVVFFALAIFLYLAPTPLQPLAIHFDHPTKGFIFSAAFPGIDATRTWFIAACLATTVVSFVTILLGRCRTSVISSILGKGIWTIALVQLLMANSIVKIDFSSLDKFAQNEWLEISPFINLGTSLVIGLLLFFLFLSMIGKFIRLGMLHAWHRRQKAQPDISQPMNI